LPAEDGAAEIERQLTALAGGQTIPAEPAK